VGFCKGPAISCLSSRRGAAPLAVAVVLGYLSLWGKRRPRDRWTVAAQ
jgi:hypothetical protein